MALEGATRVAFSRAHSLLPLDLNTAFPGAAEQGVAKAQGSSDEGGALVSKKTVNLKRADTGSDCMRSPRSALDPQPSLASDSESSERSTSVGTPQVPRTRRSGGEQPAHWAGLEGPIGQVRELRRGNASERLRMVINDSDALQSQIRQYIAQSNNGQDRRASMESQNRRASIGGPPSAAGGSGNAAVIRARSTTMPAVMRAALPSAVAVGKRAAAAAAAAGAGESKPCADGGSGVSSPVTADDSLHVGGAVNAKMVPRSMLEDMMVPLNSLDRSISEYLKEG